MIKRWPLKIIALIFGCAVPILVILLFLLYFGSPISKKQTPAPFNVSGQRVLFIAPHPDDETLACGGAIVRAEKEASAVKVVWLNNGDAGLRTTELINFTSNPTAKDYLRTGLIRHREVGFAAGVLGIKGKERIFLCYPDGSTNSLINKDWDQPHLGANGYRRSPYPFAYHKNIVYTGRNLVGDLDAIISEFKPTVIVYPDTGDLHHDHWAAGRFVEFSMKDTGYKGRCLTYLTHYGVFWPQPTLFMPFLSLSPPEGWKTQGTRTDLMLTNDEMVRKFMAMSRYASQGGPLAPNIGSFLRRNEIFYDRIGFKQN